MKLRFLNNTWYINEGRDAKWVIDKCIGACDRGNIGGSIFTIALTNVYTYHIKIA